MKYFKSAFIFAIEYKSFILLLAGSSFLITAKAQSILDGVYIRSYIIRNNDTLESVVDGKVVDKMTFQPLHNIKVEYYSSIGENLTILTDVYGDFRFSGLASDNISGKVVCFSPDYKTLKWEFNTYGISRPWEFSINFELERK